MDQRGFATGRGDRRTRRDGDVSTLDARPGLGAAVGANATALAGGFEALSDATIVASSEAKLPPEVKRTVSAGNGTFRHEDPAVHRAEMTSRATLRARAYEPGM
jgi:hypothetical protein